MSVEFLDQGGPNSINLSELSTNGSVISVVQDNNDPDNFDSMLDPNTMPQYVIDHIRRCIISFGLQDWRIEVRMYDVIDPDSPGVMGRTIYRPRYMVAFLKLGNNKDENHILQTITHELLHIVTAQNYVAINRIIELLPQNLHDHGLSLFDDSDEMVTELLSRNLTKVLIAADAGRGLYTFDPIEGFLVSIKEEDSETKGKKEVETDNSAQDGPKELLPTSRTIPDNTPSEWKSVETTPRHTTPGWPIF